MSENKKLRFGIFGLGRGVVFPFSILHLGGEVVAVCDSNKEQYEQFLKEPSHKGKIDPAYYEKFDDFIRHDMDAVILCNYFHEHAQYAIQCLDRGLHVLSETASNTTMADGVALVRAAEKSKGIYMLAENYPFMVTTRELRRVYNTGTLGKFLYGEGEYVHPCNEDLVIPLTDGNTEHWRCNTPATYYLSHSLGPLMYITGSYPKRVTAMPIYAPFDEMSMWHMRSGDRAAVILCLNDDDSVYRITGCATYAAEFNAYRICGTRGKVENFRGTDDLVNVHYNNWQVPEGQEARHTYRAELPADFPEEMRASHGGGDFGVMEEFFSCVRTGRRPKMDVYFATTIASVAILAHRSVLGRGVPYDIPDFRKEEDRVQYENDTYSPYPKDGNPPTLPCSSHPERGDDPAYLRFVEYMKTGK